MFSWTLAVLLNSPEIVYIIVRKYLNPTSKRSKTVLGFVRILRRCMSTGNRSLGPFKDLTRRESLWWTAVHVVMAVLVVSGAQAPVGTAGLGVVLQGCLQLPAGDPCFLFVDIRDHSRPFVIVHPTQKCHFFLLIWTKKNDKNIFVQWYFALFCGNWSQSFGRSPPPSSSRQQCQFLMWKGDHLTKRQSHKGMVRWRNLLKCISSNWAIATTMRSSQHLHPFALFLPSACRLLNKCLLGPDSKPWEACCASGTTDIAGRQSREGVAVAEYQQLRPLWLPNRVGGLRSSGGTPPCRHLGKSKGCCFL